MKQKTETQLCISFMELLRKYPFPKITIATIASECGVNRQTFYYHFDNIYDLMGRAFEIELMNDESLSEGSSREEVMRHFLCWMRDNKVIIKNILTNVEAGYLRKAIYPLVFRVMGREEDHDGNEKEEGVGFTEHFLVIGITQYILEWAESDFKENVDDIIRELFSLIKKIYA